MESADLVCEALEGKRVLMVAASRRHIDVALVDIELRGEVVSPLAIQLRERRIPFLLASAYQSGEVPRSLRSAACLRKPFTDSDVLSGLAALLKPSYAPID
jgi:CheY-like chemotaxis protein